MNTVELRTIAVPSDSPPPYSEVASTFRTHRRTTTATCSATALISSIRRDDCYDPCSPDWPGVCRRCLLLVIIDFLIIMLRLAVMAVCVTLLTRLHGWKFTCVIVMIAAVFLTTIKTSFGLSRCLSVIGRISQAAYLVISAILFALSKDYSGPGTYSEVVEENKTVFTTDAVAIILLALSTTCFALTFRCDCDCIWMGPECCWKALFFCSLSGVALGILVATSVPVWSVNNVTLACGSVLIALLVRDTGRGLLKTCAFKNNRYKSIGSLTPIGTAQTDRRNSQQERVVENDVSFRYAGYATYDVLIALLLLLWIPAVVAIQRAYTSAGDRFSYEKEVYTAFCGALVGVTCAIPFPKEPSVHQRAITPGRIVTVVIMGIGVILSGTKHNVGPVVYTVGASMSALIAVSCLRETVTGQYRLSVACLAKAVLAVHLFACAITGPSSWLIDNIM